MDLEKKLEEIKSNNQAIIELQKNRNYKELIDVYQKSLILDKTLGNQWKRLPQIAYCYVKLENFRRAKEVIDEYGGMSGLADHDEVYRATLLISLFIQTENDPYALDMVKNTVKSWCYDPKSANQTKSIVFDYHVYI